MDMFSQEETDVSLPLVDEPVRRESLTYEDIVKDFILEENQYLHDLNMIIKVFRAPFETHFPGSKVNIKKISKFFFLYLIFFWLWQPNTLKHFGQENYSESYMRLYSQFYSINCSKKVFKPFISLIYSIHSNIQNHGMDKLWRIFSFWPISLVSDRSDL